MFKLLKRFFGSTEEVEVAQDAVDGDDAIMKAAMLAITTGKVVYGDYEDGVLTSRVSQEEND